MSPFFSFFFLPRGRFKLLLFVCKPAESRCFLCCSFSYACEPYLHWCSPILFTDGGSLIAFSASPISFPICRVLCMVEYFSFSSDLVSWAFKAATEFSLYFLVVAFILPVAFGLFTCVMSSVFQASYVTCFLN